MSEAREQAKERVGASHPARPIARLHLAQAVFGAGLAATLVWSGKTAEGLLLLAVAAGAIATGRSVGLRLEVAHLTSSAMQQLARGDFAATESLLASIPARSAKGPIVKRAVATLRALIALYEGRLDDAVRYATRAVEARLGLAARDFEACQVASAHAIRALAHAALRDAPRAKADADAAEGSIHATPETIARARLARAIGASRAAYHEEAFRLYLDANARLVLEHAMPRERALFRALRRMAETPQRGVYREPARARDDRPPSKLARWIAYVVPEAAAHVEGDRMLAGERAEAPVSSGVPSDVRALRRARSEAASAASVARPGKTIAGLLVLVAAFLAIAWVDHLLATRLLTVVAAVAWIVGVARARRTQRALVLAQRYVALGERDRARPALVRLAERGSGIEAAGAGLELARIAAAEADFAEAIARCDAAIACVSAQPLRALTSDALLPALMTESAVAMAARGGLEDADAELAVLCRDFPTFPELAAAQLRVRLVRCVRAGDREAACSVARARTAEMPLPYREEVLADLVLASRSEVADLDLARLDAELRDDAELRAWIDAVAPNLLRAGTCA